MTSTAGSPGTVSEADTPNDPIVWRVHHGSDQLAGEVTGGGAHPTQPRPIDSGLYGMLPWEQTINPITNGNWKALACSRTSHHRQPALTRYQPT